MFLCVSNALHELYYTHTTSVESRDDVITVTEFVEVYEDFMHNIWCFILLLVQFHIVSCVSLKCIVICKICQC